MSRVEEPVVMENVRIIFRNFEGKEGPFNKPGERNFGVVLPPDVAEAMARDGWNVKYLDPRDEDEIDPNDPLEGRTPWLSVKVAYDKGRPPKIMLITSRGKTALDEATVKELDWADITNVDLIVSPFNWEINQKAGVAAYCKSMFVTIEEDELERKYAEMDGQ